MQKRPNTTGRKRGCGEADRGVVGGGAFRGDVPQGDQARARRVLRSGHRAGCVASVWDGVWLACLVVENGHVLAAGAAAKGDVREVLHMAVNEVRKRLK